MSKESNSKEAIKCICGNTFAFMEQHWQHCPMNPTNLSPGYRKVLEAEFTKSEIAHIAQHGGKLQDQPIAARRKGKGNAHRNKARGGVGAQRP